jgi:SAM-dependent methyltransferase
VASDHLRRIERVYSPSHYVLYEELARSLDPRGPDLLLDVAAAYVEPESRILDIGCRDAKYLIRLVGVHGCRGIGLDPLDWHVERARTAVAEADLARSIEIVKGVMEQIPEPDESFDFIWSRDVLVLVEGLQAGLDEAARVLKPGGRMLVYTNFATELLEPEEARRLNAPLGNVAENFDEAVVDAAFAKAGLQIVTKDVIATEWREYEEERDRPVSQDLLYLARLRRMRTEFVAQHGLDRFELTEASLQWRPYQLLGKLKPVLYVLERS